MKYECGDDLLLSANNQGEAFPCPCCHAFTLNENYQASVSHLGTHGYVEKPDNPNRAAGIMPGQAYQDPVWFHRPA
jgi:hypothetical protein